jgi:hypothetical protein
MDWSNAVTRAGSDSLKQFEQRRTLIFQRCRNVGL